MKKEQKLKIYFDGLCVVCSREIEHYRHQAGSGQIDFVDICAPNFDAVKEGVDPFKIHKDMHAKTPDGKLVTRVQAFIEIWQRLPRYQWLARLAKRRYIRPGLELGYSAFTQVRPFLPRRKKSADCSESPYCEVNNG